MSGGQRTKDKGALEEWTMAPALDVRQDWTNMATDNGRTKDNRDKGRTKDNGFNNGNVAR